jgi:hypothetical protein
VVTKLREKGNNKVFKYFFSKQYHHGCGGHPDLEEHKLIADELTQFLKKVENW